MSSTIFYPKTRNFPHQPQVLHQMVLQFFLMTDKFESVFADQTSTHGMIMPYGSYFDTGLLQAASYRYRLRPLQATTIYIISFADLPESIDILGCNYEALHTFF